MKLCQSWQMTDQSQLLALVSGSLNNSTCFPSTFAVQISEGLTKYSKHILCVNATDLTAFPLTQAAVWYNIIVIFLRPHREWERMVGGDPGSPDPGLCCPSTLHWLQPGAEPCWSFKSILPGLTWLKKILHRQQGGIDGGHLWWTG